jgi:hypothetical protein
MGINNIQPGPDRDTTVHPLRGCVRPSDVLFLWVADILPPGVRPAEPSAAKPPVGFKIRDPIAGVCSQSCDQEAWT